eukprot:816802-Prorocentrum_minimum.AAC.2
MVFSDDTWRKEESETDEPYKAARAQNKVSGGLQGVYRGSGWSSLSLHFTFSSLRFADTHDVAICVGE